MELQKILQKIKTEYPQELISLPTYDYQLKTYTPRLGPKYLYRGENEFYSETKSYYQRLLTEHFFTNEEWNEVKRVILDLCEHIILTYFELVPKSDPKFEATITAISVIMQHYGLPILSIDFTSDLEIAACFCRLGNKNRRGRIAVLSSVELPNLGWRINDLTQGPWKRPKNQKAYTLSVLYNTDLKNVNTIQGMKIKWFDFILEDCYLEFYKCDSILGTEDDEIASTIKNYFDKITLGSQKIEAYFKESIQKLQ